MNLAYPAALTTVLLAEPFELSRRGIRDVLRESTGFAPNVELADASDVAEIFLSSSPDLLVLGFAPNAAPERTAALLALASIVGRTPSAHILAIISEGSTDMLIAAAEGGAMGIVARDGPDGALLDCARTVAGGQCALDPRLVCSVLEYFHESPTTHQNSAGAPAVMLAARPLTAREQDVLEELVHGLSNLEIGQRLDVASATVKSHVKQICRKLGARDRTEAILMTVAPGQQRS